MTEPGLTNLEIALLCRLYYLGPSPTDRLLEPYRGPNELHAVLAEQLAGIGAADAHGRLGWLVAQRQITSDGTRWQLTDRGRALAYEAGELEIQRRSGFWEMAGGLLPAPGRAFARVVDVGSAGGSAGTAMREAGLLAARGTYLGVDISHRALLAGIELSRWHGEEDFLTGRVQGTAYRLPLAPASIDCCVSRSTLYYLQKHRVLTEMARVLRKGGFMIVAVPTIAYMSRRALHGWTTLRPREAVKYTAATLLGVVGWLGVDVSPPGALFSGETKRSLRTQLAGIPGLRLLFLERVSLPFIGRPLLLVAEKTE